MKMGTQQLIPKGLASDSKQSKAASSGQQGLGGGFAGLLGLDSSKRALKTLSMVETGTFFSTGVGSDGDGGDSPGTLRRGLRSTSYRRAVVSEEEVPASKASKPTLKGLQEAVDTPASPTSPGSSPTSPKQLSTTDGPAKPSSPGSLKPASPGNVKPSSPGTRKSATLGKSKVGQMMYSVVPFSLHQLSWSVIVLVCVLGH